MAASSELRFPASITDDRRRRALTVGAVVLLTVGLTVALVRTAAGPDADHDGLARADALVRDDDNFATATESGVTFTKVSTTLEQEADDCRPATAPRCETLFAAAGYARVSAVAVLRCTRPGVFDARTSLRTLLHDLEREPAPDIPVVVTCR